MPDKELTIEEILAAFSYSGNKLKLDIELVQWRILKEADRLVDELIYEKMRLVRQGLSSRQADSIIKDMIDNSDGIVKSWYNRQDKVIAELTNHLVHTPTMEFEDQNPGTKFDWVLGVVKTSHCSDCTSLAQIEPRTIDKWRELGYGLPREGQTECSYGCKCMLEPVELKKG